MQLPNCKKKSAAHKNGFEVLVVFHSHFLNKVNIRIYRSAFQTKIRSTQDRNGLEVLVHPLPTSVPNDDAVGKEGCGVENVSKSDGVILVWSLRY